MGVILFSPALGVALSCVAAAVVAPVTYVAVGALSSSIAGGVRERIGAAEEEALIKIGCVALGAIGVGVTLFGSATSIMVAVGALSYLALVNGALDGVECPDSLEQIGYILMATVAGATLGGTVFAILACKTWAVGLNALLWWAGSGAALGLAGGLATAE